MDDEGFASTLLQDRKQLQSIFFSFDQSNTSDFQIVRTSLDMSYAQNLRLLYLMLGNLFNFLTNSNSKPH